MTGRIAAMRDAMGDLRSTRQREFVNQFLSQATDVAKSIDAPEPGFACNAQAKAVRQIREIKEMKRIATFLVTILTGAVACAQGSPDPRSQMVGGNQPSQFVVLDPTGSYFMNQKTRHPVFMQGEQAYNLATELSSPSDIQLYLSTRKSEGFNFIWVSATDMGNHDHSPDDNWPTYGSGTAPFGATPFLEMNEKYFEHLDYVLQQAAAYGFEVLLMPAYAGSGPTYCGDPHGWCLELQAASVATLRAFGAWLGHRYANYPNIIWLMGGDLDLVHYPVLQAKEEAMLAGIRSADPNHLITSENEPGTTGFNSQDHNGGSAWPSGSWQLDSFYHDVSGSPRQGTMNGDTNAAYMRSDHLPTYLLEDSLEGEVKSPSDLGQRTEKYQAVLGGATLGAVFGNCVVGTLGFHYRECTRWTNSTQWKTTFNTAGATAMRYFGKLFRSREFWKLVPDSSHAVLKGGIGSGATQSVAACTSDGQTCMVYDPRGNSQNPQIAMSHFSGTIHGWWFNPQTGSTTDLGTFTKNGMHTFTPTDGNDWILVLDLDSASLPAPGTSTE
jgi:hypothetical protein